MAICPQNIRLVMPNGAAQKIFIKFGENMGIEFAH